MAQTEVQVPRMDWASLVEHVDWRQGDHVTLIGPTGAGKTTAALSLLAERERRDGYIIAIFTKPKDPVAKRLEKNGYWKIRKWPPPKRRKHILLWPDHKTLGDTAGQTEAVAYTLDGVFRDRSWCVYIDELYWVSNRLGMAPLLRDLWLQGRSCGVTLVASAQRPRNVPVEAYSSSAHLLIWRTNDDEDLKRLSGLGAAPNKTVQSAVQSLDFRKHEVLWVDTRQGDLYITKAPKR